ncbi:MAG: YdcF family protein [Clostridiales bacterium]|nr:YdcF family protein [Clostridiales bacterium]
MKKKSSMPLGTKTVLWLCAALIVFMLPFAVNQAVVSAALPYLYENAEQCEILDADCILVLGALVYDNQGSLSPVLQDRMECALQLLGQGVSDRLLLSGDHGTDEYDEVNSMLCYANKRGVDKSLLFQDHAGFSTYESMVRAKEIFECKKIVIVTQKSHLYRAVYIARSLGMEAYGVAADLRPYANQKSQELREFMARNKDFLSCLLHIRPTYGGEAIPITGNAAASHDR